MANPRRHAGQKWLPGVARGRVLGRAPDGFTAHGEMPRIRVSCRDVADRLPPATIPIACGVPADEPVASFGEALGR